MKTLLVIGGLILIVIIGVSAIRSIGDERDITANVMNSQDDGPVSVTPLSHASMVLEWDGTSIYVDPVGTSTELRSRVSANDIILVTDIHSDHLSTSTLATLLGSTGTAVGTSSATGTGTATGTGATSTVNSSTILIVPQAVRDMLPSTLASRVGVLDNDESVTVRGFRITAVPMYNLPESADSRHPKGRGNGYIIERDGYRVYIAGDTSGTPEMRGLSSIDMAFVPMNLPFTMSVEDAADAVVDFAPKIVYPYHYRGENGYSDIQRFRQLVNAEDPDIDVRLVNWYPNDPNAPSVGGTATSTERGTTSTPANTGGGNGNTGGTGGGDGLLY